MLLNSKSILECDEFEEKVHNEEIKKIANQVYNFPNYQCVVVYKYKDTAHKEQKEIIRECYLHDFLDVVEYVDIKNGIDLAITDNDLLTIIAYGQCYELNGICEKITTYIYIMPYNDEREFLDISNKIKNYNFYKNDMYN